MAIKKVLAIGGGVMGSQVSFHHAMHGYDIVQYDINDEAIEHCKKLHHSYIDSFRAACPQFSLEDIEEGLARIRYSTNLEEAGKDVDMVSESAPEVPEIKQELYTKLAQICPEHTIFTTNTSTMLPSKFAEYTGRPDRFLALHYANPVWQAPIAEVMKHPGTSQVVFDEVVDYAEASKLVPIKLEKEQPGYVINSLLVPWLDAALTMVVNDITTPEQIDKTWMLCFKGTPLGPMGVYDIVGFEVARNISKLAAQAQPNNPIHQKKVDYLEENFLNKGLKGVTTGQGFYSYPNPAYQDPDFLK